MDADSFDRWIRTLSSASSRRRMLGALAPVLLSLGAVPVGAVPVGSAAGGCKHVGKRCDNDDDCCSGACRGGKHKRCKAHDSGGCTAGANSCGGSYVPCTTSTGLPGHCDTTTGNAGYCGSEGDCRACRRDKDCRPLFGRHAACIKNCTVCPQTDGFACSGNREAA